MKKILLLLTMLQSLVSSSQVTFTEVQRCKQIGLVWGLMKYHHPEVSKGKYNWDSEFVSLFSKANEISNQEEMNVLLSNFIHASGDKFKLEKGKTTIDKEHLFIKNYDYSWINASVFGENLTNQLLKIKDNTNINDYYASASKLTKMLTFDNEKGYKDYDLSLKSHRMLMLYNFWNVIQYWDVNKYLMDEDWLKCLDSLTEEFLKANTKTKFEMAKAKMLSKLNDTHSFYFPQTVSDSLTKYRSYFSSKIVNDTVVVLGVQKSLAKKDGLELGDRIVKIEHQSIPDCLHEKLGDLISVSNPTVLRRYGYLLFNSNKDSINVDVVSNDGILKNKYLHLYEKIEWTNFETLPFQKRDKWTLIKPDISYINLSEITRKELKEAFGKISDTKGLIIDLRNYPQNISNADIADYLYPGRKEFVKVLFPVGRCPSVGEYNGDSPLDFISDPFKIGKKYSNYYKGKVVLLVNRMTQSRAEWIGMSIQQSPNCVTVGEQTAGAAMNTVSYTLSDKTKVLFTHLGAFYPNGEGVQRKGLHIDYVVKENAKNYDPDLYVKEAVRIIEKIE
ncbi:MAG: S41 family peptidase [Flavobacterium sp.]